MEALIYEYRHEIIEHCWKYTNSHQLDFKIWKISILGARPPQFLVAFPVKVERCVIALNAQNRSATSFKLIFLQ